MFLFSEIILKVHIFPPILSNILFISNVNFVHKSFFSFVSKFCKPTHPLLFYLKVLVCSMLFTTFSMIFIFLETFKDLPYLK